MFLIIEFSFRVLGCQTEAQRISEHCVFQECSRYKKKTLKIEEMVPKLKESLKIGEECLKLVQFMGFIQQQKKQKNIGFVQYEKFHLELAKDKI